MKKFIMPVIAFFVIAFGFVAGFMESLKLTQEDAESAIWYSFSDGAYSGPSSTEYHNFSVPVRVSMIKEIGAFAKTYTKSEGFKKKYLEYREDKKPNAPEPLVPLKQLKEEQRANLQKTLAEAETNSKKFTGDTKKAFDEAIKIMKEQLKQLDDPNNPMWNSQMEQMRKQGYDQSMKTYQEEVTKWQKDYPESPTLMIKSRLKYFLELSATVDFNAKLKDKDGLKVFVNEAYENQSGDWKYIFRAGKESSDAARAIATQWMGELK